MKNGYSVIEILVVIGVFAVLGIIATQSVNLSLTSSKKSDSVTTVKQELDYAAGNIERNLQVASEIYCPINVATPSVGFRNAKGYRGDYACLDMPGYDFYDDDNDKRIASSSGESPFFNQRLTSGNINISDCSFTCTSVGTQKYVDFSVTATIKGLSSSEGALVTTSKKILVKEIGKK